VTARLLEAPAALPVVRAADLHEPDPERAWLVADLWARAGVGIIGGAPKCCKSWLALDLALSVASGTPCLGRFAVVGSQSVLLYMAEDAASVVKARLAGICRHRQLDLAALPIDVITAASLRLDLERDQHRLAETVRRHAPRLLVLDPFVRLHRIDENHAGDVSALLAYLRTLQREYDLAVVVVHHARKNAAPGAAPGQGLRGSGDFHAWGDSNLYLRRLRGELALTIEHRAAAAPAPRTLALVTSPPDQTHLEIQEAVRTSDQGLDLDAAVLRALDQAGPMTRESLRAALRVRNQRLSASLQRLADGGHLLRHGHRWAYANTAVPSHDSLEKQRDRNGPATL
jgi:AAA domain